MLLLVCVLVACAAAVDVVDLSPANVNELQGEEHHLVFFTVSWCKTCRGIFNQLPTLVSSLRVAMVKR